MSNTTTHGHWVHANAEGYDLGFIEAAHYDREASFQPLSPAQTPVDGTTNVEMYASKDVAVLALPTLYCMAHASEHACAYVHTLVPDMGVCDLSFVTDPGKYVRAEREGIVAQKSYTGRVTR